MTSYRDSFQAVAVVAVVVAVVGCSNAPRQEDRTEAAQSASRAPGATVRPATAGSVQESEGQKIARLLKNLEGQSLYFAYDDFTIQAKHQQLIQAHAAVLMQAGRGTVVLEGNADERGSREYNLALGQKRADAVARAMKTHGVPADRMEAVSFGKEKPRSACHEERCWAENRRVDFSYKLK